VRLVLPSPVAEPWNHPVTYTAPSAPTATEVPRSSLVPPKRCAHTASPVDALSLATNTSSQPALVRLVLPNAAAEPEKYPITYTAPSTPTATERPLSMLVPPKRCAHSVSGGGVSE